MKKYLIISTLVMGMGIFAADTKPLTIQEIERLPFDDAFQQWLQSPEIQNPYSPLLYSMAISDAKTGKFTPTPFWALTCHLGQDAHRHEPFLISALKTNDNVSLILDSSPVLCNRYGVNSESTVKFDPNTGYTFVMRGGGTFPDGRKTAWLDAIKKFNSQTNSAGNQSQTNQPATSGHSSVAGATTSLTNMFPGYLEGDFQIRHASARPAARTYFLIRAAAYDRYANDNNDVLASHPPLACLIQEAKSHDILSFDRYSDMVSGGFTPIVDRKRELADLERFVASGYSGDLKPQLLAYVEELKK